MPTTTHDGAEGTAEEERWTERSRFPAAVLACLAAAVGVLVIAGLLAGTDVLQRFGELSRATTTFLTAFLALVLAAGVLLTRQWQRWTCFGVAALVAGLVIVEHLAGVSLGIDELVVSPPGETPPAATPGRPSLVTASSLSLLSLGGLALTGDRRHLAQVPVIAALVLSMASGFAYLYRAEPVTDSGTPEMMPVAATVIVAALSLALLYSIRGSVAQWATYGRDTGATLQRSVAPVVFVALPLMGLGLVRSLESGYLDTRGAVALSVTFCVALVMFIAGWLAVGSRRLDEEREGLLREVRRVNAQLEDRVRLRSHEVNRQRTKLALLEERDRIARDLHDRVIQRIFAAGLQIGALSRTVSRVAEGADASRLPGQLDAIATELDLAIRELRNSIFQLTSIDDHQDLEQVVHDIATRSSRILGFMPRITVGGELGDVRSDLAADLASAVQEGLSNVARHARADSAEVVLRGTDTELVVCITDDGVGLPDPLPRSSGISNLMNRARGLGGTATWEPNLPHGTVFTWRVSRDGTSGEFYGNDVGALGD